MKGRRSRQKRIDHVGVSKHKIPTKDVRSTGILQYFFSSRSLERLQTFTYYCDDLLYKSACKLRVVPFEYQDARSFTMSPMRRRWVHYCYLLAWVGIIFVRFEGLFQEMASSAAIGVPTFICATSLSVAAGPFLIAMTGFLMPQKTMDLFHFIEQTQNVIGWELGCQVTYKKSLSVTLKVFLGTASLFIISGDNTFLSLIMSDLPVFTYPVLKRLGIVPEGLLSDFTWTLVLLPLEYATNFLFCLSASVSGNLLMTSAGAYSTCLKAIRAVPRKTAQDHELIQRLYLIMQIFNRVFADWMRVFLPLAISSISFAVVVVTYVAVRGDQLPGPVYICFPIMGIFLYGIVFWMSYDGMMFKRMSEEVVGGLQSRVSEYLKDLERSKKLEILKRAKACRPASVPIGGFGELSFDLPVDIWEESLDQLLVLLTL